MKDKADGERAVLAKIAECRKRMVERDQNYQRIG
jgi:hypothetical protein